MHDVINYLGFLEIEFGSSAYYSSIVPMRPKHGVRLDRLSLNCDL